MPTHARPRGEGPSHLPLEPALPLHCTFTTYDVEVPNNIIFLRPDTATGLTSPVRPHYNCARLRSPAVYTTALGNNAVWITCTAVSANGRPRAHLTQANPSMSLSPSRLRCLQTTHSTRELRLLWTTALLYTPLSSSSTQINSPCFSFPPPFPLFFPSGPPTSYPSHCSDSALTTLDRPAQARMLTALSIEQYSFSIFTTLLYRPPCGIALDVYNYS